MDVEKNYEIQESQSPVRSSDSHELHGAPAGELHRGLHARHITMIAIGGAIGTGLIIGTGQGLARAGPAPILIAYCLVGFLVYLVMCAVGEMATWIPLGSGFTGYANRYADPAVSFALGYTYWFKYLIVTPNQLTAAALVLQLWVPREKVNPGVFIAVFLVVILAINILGIRYFGEFEFWLSSLKVLIIIGVIILSAVLALGGGPNHDRTGFRFWNDPGAFHAYILTGASGRFLAVWSSMITATFAFLGTELVGVTAGEAQNPRRTIPKAIKLTFFRILVFYIFSVFLLGMLVPYNSPELAFSLKATTSASASPYVVAIKLAGIRFLPGIFNGCILVFVLSAANTDLYVASRTLYGMAAAGNAPRIFTRTNARGVPYYALGVSALFALLAFMNVSDDSKQVFTYFVNLVTIFGLLTWISLLYTHICFVRARKAQNIPVESLAYTAPLGAAGSWGALAFSVLIAFTKNFPVFVHSPKTYGNFDYKNFITGYLGIPLYLIMLFGWKLIKKTKPVDPLTADLFSGKAAIDLEEEEFLASQAERMKGSSKWGARAYRVVGYIF